MQQGRVRISVVTPTHNRPESVLRLLHALRDGTFPTTDFEVVIVADGCTDDTCARARAEPVPFAIRVLELTPGRGAAAARNAGAAAAIGELLLFLDDDIEPFPALLDEHWHEYQKAETPTVVVGPPRPVRTPNAGLHAIAMWGWWEHQFSMMRRPGHRFTYDNVFTGNLSLPRSMFASVDGFDDDFQCREDSEFGFRLMRRGGRVAFAPAAAAWHHELRDTAALNSRKQAEGVADVRLALLYPELWPALYLALPDKRRSRPYRALCWLTFTVPRLGRLAAGVLHILLPPLEATRLRGTWRRLQAGLMYYWYWVGVARALGSYGAFEQLRTACLSRAAATPVAPDLEIDLAQGLESAERALDAAQPAGVTIHWGSLYVGRIPPQPGSEPLGGRHLRAALTDELAQPLTSVLAAVATTGSPILRHADAPAVSVVIPAYNAAETLGETLDSLIQQTSRRWEAIVVDDGSTDDTAEIAARYARRDARIRVLRQPNGGEGAARNTGLSEAQFDWVLFLDADDWLLPNALRILARAAAESGLLDAMIGSWSRVAADGTVLEPEYCPATGDLFPLFARHCAIPIHTALVRRSALPSDCFDTTLKTCADWDFWQRFARSGARFGRVSDVVARYRMRTGSPATAVAKLWPDGLRVIAQGHAKDERVANARHPAGAPKEELSDARFLFACWVAGLIIGHGDEANEVLAGLAGECDPGLNPAIVADQLYRTMPLANAQPPEAWDDLWPVARTRVAAFLDAIERQSEARLFARRAMRVLERLTLDVSRVPRPFTRGDTYAVDVDVSQPLPPFVAAPGVERAHCVVLAGGARIGSVLVPIGPNPEANRRTLMDEIARCYAWPILDWLLREGPYRDLALLRGPRGITASRQRIVLATGLTDAEAITPARLHDHAGWNVFLQELWDHSDWPGERFYDTEQREPVGETRQVDSQRLTIEVSTPLPTLQVPPEISTLELDVRVGGHGVGIVSLPVSAGEVLPAQIRTAITLQGSFELCRAAVRQGVLDQSAAAGALLRARLAGRAADATAGSPSGRAFPAMPNEARPLQRGGFDRHHFESVFAAATDPWSYVTPYEQLKYEQTLSLLPAGDIARALELACAEGRFTRQLAPRVGELLATDISTVALERAQRACADSANVRFVQLDIVSDPMPNGFDVIVCSEVLYYVGSEEVLLQVGEKLRDALTPGGRLILAHTNVAADDPYETALAWDVPFGAKRIGELLGQLPNVRFVHELRTELYRIQVFQRDDATTQPGNGKGSAPGEPEFIEQAAYVPPAPHVAARFRRSHETRVRGAVPEGPTTPRLPILMYHDVAHGSASDAGSRYRLSPNAFAAQLDYLHCAGFRAVTLAEWSAAMHYRRPLPGRAVVFTFDDAYRNFAQHAFPLLQKYGYPATVFVPCGFVGTTNAWDAGVVEQVPLLSWEEMRALAANSIQFGAHSMTHAPLTGLENAQVLREAAECKAMLERELGAPVTAFAYPHGDNDAVIQQLVASCGFTIAVSTRFGRAGFNDPSMSLPRIEVTGNDDLATFIAKLDA